MVNKWVCLVSLNYKEFGYGKPVALLHGLFGMGDNLTPLAKKLAERYRVIVFDLPNHGLSDNYPDLNFSFIAELVKESLERLSIESCAVVGHSLGGKVAMQMALNSPESVNALVIADIAPIDYPANHDHILAALIELDGMHLSRQDASNWLQSRIDSSFLTSFLMKSYKKDEDGEWGFLFGLEGLSNSYENLRRANSFHSQVDTPVLFIKGELSEYLKLEFQPEIESRFSSVSYKVINGAGHWLHAEKPAVFNKLVMDFLGGCYV